MNFRDEIGINVLIDVVAIQAAEKVNFLNDSIELPSFSGVEIIKILGLQFINCPLELSHFWSDIIIDDCLLFSNNFDHFGVSERSLHLFIVVDNDLCE